MKIYSRLGSVALLLVIISFASGNSTLSVEDCLNILEDKLVERDNEIQQLKNTVEAISQHHMSLTSGREFNSDEASPKNVTMDVITNNSTQGEANEHNDSEDSVLNVRQSRVARASSESVAFYAHLSNPGCLNDDETVVFDTEVTDVSGSYNEHDGILDIPATGTYVLTVTVIASEFRWISLEIISNGKSLGAAVADSEDLPSHHSGSITIVVNLQLGDHVFVRKKGSNASCAIHSSSAGFTSFADWLLG